MFKIRNVVFVLFIAGLIFCVRQLFENSRQLNLPISEVKPETLASAGPSITPYFRHVELPKTHATAQNEKKIELSVSEKTVPRYARKPVDLTVEFEVVDGMAIAYGDTVLGKPSGDFSGSQGLTEVALPQYWDHGVVPFVIKDDISQPERVKLAIEVFQTQTSVRFVPYDHQKDAIVFSKGDENCYSYLGRIGGLQPIYLSDKCSPPEIEHELMHALGFIHEQSRTDRDQYLDILWENIEEKYQAQFAMAPEVFMNVYDNSPFDALSIMMYDAHAFAKQEGLETMRMKNGEQLKQKTKTLSPTDIERINRLYPTGL